MRRIRHSLDDGMTYQHRVVVEIVMQLLAYDVGIDGVGFVFPEDRILDIDCSSQLLNAATSDLRLIVSKRAVDEIDRRTVTHQGTTFETGNIFREEAIGCIENGIPKIHRTALSGCV